MTKFFSLHDILLVNAGAVRICKSLIRVEMETEPLAPNGLGNREMFFKMLTNYFLLGK